MLTATASAQHLPPVVQGETTAERDDRGAGFPAASRVSALGDLAADAAPMTLAEIQRLAVEHHPAIAEAAAGVAAAAGRRLQAGLPPNPEIGYSGQQLFGGGEVEQQGVLYRQTWIRGEKLQWSRAVAHRELQKEEWAAEQVQRTVLAESAAAYYRLAGAQLRRQLAEASVGLTRQELDAARRLLELRQGSRADVLQAEVEWESATARLRDADAVVAGGWRELAAAVGLPELEPRPMADLLEHEAEPLQAEPTLLGILAGNPRLRQAESEIDRAQAAWRRACAEPIPDLTFDGVVQRDNDTRGVNANLQLSFPLPAVNRNQGAIRAAQAEVSQAHFAAERIRLELQAKFAKVWARYEAAGDRVEHFRTAILPKAAEHFELIRHAYELGQLDFFRVSTAQRAYAEQQAAYVDAVIERSTLRAELEALR